MRRILLTSLAAAAVALLAWTTPAQAQSYGVVDANIPFPFVVVNTTLPAGHYIVTRSDATDPAVWTISNAEGTIHVDFLTEDAEQPLTNPGTDLLFDQLGGRNFLAQVWIAGDQQGVSVERGRTEEALMRTMKPVRRAVTCTPMKGQMHHHA